MLQSSKISWPALSEKFSFALYVFLKLALFLLRKESSNRKKQHQKKLKAL